MMDRIINSWGPTHTHACTHPHNLHMHIYTGTCTQTDRHTNTHTDALTDSLTQLTNSLTHTNTNSLTHTHTNTDSRNQDVGLNEDTLQTTSLKSTSPCSVPHKCLSNTTQPSQFHAQMANQTAPTWPNRTKPSNLPRSPHFSHCIHRVLWSCRAPHTSALRYFIYNDCHHTVYSPYAADAGIKGGKCVINAFETMCITNCFQFGSYICMCIRIKQLDICNGLIAL